MYSELEQIDQHNNQIQLIKLKSAQAVAQKHLQILKIKQLSFGAGSIMSPVLLRAYLQFIPSVEPIMLFAILNGWLYGKRQGFVVGASALFLSNFLVAGGQGPWTIFQMLGFGLSGSLAGLLLRKKASRLEFVSLVMFSTFLYELIMNVSSIPYFGIWRAFVPAIPFGAIHLTSNIIFALGVYQLKSKFDKTGKFDQKEYCETILKSLKKQINDTENRDNTESEGNIQRIDLV